MTSFLGIITLLAMQERLYRKANSVVSFKLVTTDLKRSTLTNYRTGMIVATIIRPKLIDCGGLSSLAAHQSLLGRRPLNVK